MPYAKGSEAQNRLQKAAAASASGHVAWLGADGRKNGGSLPAPGSRAHPSSTKKLKSV
jgi:hypothetical protein